jgi:hypothetical protein
MQRHVADAIYADIGFLDALKNCVDIASYDEDELKSFTEVHKPFFYLQEKGGYIPNRSLVSRD